MRAAALGQGRTGGQADQGDSEQEMANGIHPWKLAWGFAVCILCNICITS